MTPQYADSHCHINFSDLHDRIDDVMHNMQQAGVTQALCVGTSLEELPSVLAVAERYANVYASVGVHPDYEDTTEPTVEQLVKLAEHPRVVAIGETGLDYFRLTGDLEWQRERFRTHIRAARQCNKPLIIHTRAAAEDTLRLMREEGAEQPRGVMHCFTESLQVAQAAIELGFYISFSGIVTFKNAAALREVAQTIPLERMLIETDSPYLAPVPHRGKTNEPAFVTHVAACIAGLRDISVEEVAATTYANYMSLFRIPPGAH